MKYYPRRKIVCKVCGLLKPRQAFDMCNACYRMTAEQKRKRTEYDAIEKRRKYKVAVIQAGRKFNKYKKPCEDCGEEESQKHHRDGNVFNNTLSNIKWLCQICHGKAHRK